MVDSNINPFPGFKVIAFPAPKLMDVKAEGIEKVAFASEVSVETEEFDTGLSASKEVTAPNSRPNPSSDFAFPE
jgi:hypothetical protein